MYCSNWMLKGGVNRGCSSAIRKTHLRMSPRGGVFVKFHQRTREGACLWCSSSRCVLSRYPHTQPFVGIPPNGPAFQWEIHI